MDNSKLPEFSRRNFLKVAAAAVAAPYIIPASALGKDGHVAPSERVVMGGIGIGNMGTPDQGSFLSHDGVQYVAVCDVRKKYREAALERVNSRYGTKDCKAYIDFREMLARTDIDAVHIATPDHWHAVLAIAACRAGKDVYCQKPESLTIKEGRAMVNAARRFGRVFSGGSQRVMGDHMPEVQKYWSGKTGNAKEIYIQCGNPPITANLPSEPVPDDIDWDLWLGPAPEVPYHHYRADGAFRIDGTTWRSFRDYSGGGMTDWGAHRFGAAMFVVNRMEDGPCEVIPPDGKEYVAALTYKFADGLVMYRNHPKEPASVKVVGDGQQRAAVPVPRYSGTGGIYGDFIACVKSRQKPFRDIERAHRTATICHLGNIALMLNRPLKWDPIKEDFINDPQASRYLDRARREPWTI